MAEYPTVAVRVSDEVKELFDELSNNREFKNKGEFLNHLLLIYQAEQIKEEVSTIKPAIDAAQDFMRKFLDILIGVGSSITLGNEKHITEIQELNDSSEKAAGLLQERILILTQEIKENEERAATLLNETGVYKDKISELLLRISQLENSVKDKDKIIAATTEKYNSLNDMVLEYKGYADKNKELSNTIEDLEDQIEKLDSRITGYVAQIDGIKEGHQIEIERLKSSAALERDTALLKKESEIVELQKSFQSKLNEQQEKYNSSIAEYQEQAAELLRSKFGTLKLKRAPKQNTDIRKADE